MSPEEIDAVEGRSVNSRKAIADLYDDLVRDLTEGDDIELELEPDERRQTVIARLKAAAARRKPALQIEFKAHADPIVLHFHVPVLTPPIVQQAPPPAPRPPMELPDLPDLIDDQSQSMLNLRDTRDRRSQQMRNNRYDRRDRPNPNRSGTAHVQRSNGASRFQSSGRPSQPIAGPRNNPSPSNGPRNNPSPSNGPRNNPSPSNGPRNNPSPSNGPRNNPSPSNGPRNNPSPSNGPRNNAPTDRPPATSFNRYRQRRRPR
jgi:hypothetical protein